MNEPATPFELVFGAELEAKLQGIREEAREREVDPRERERFSMLLGTGEVLRELLPDDAEIEAVQQIAALVFYCFHYWQEGKRTFEIDEAELRNLLSPSYPAGSDSAPPHAAGYVKLPRNRLWSRIAEAWHAEAVDGFFYVDGDILLVLGLMAGRPGFSIMEVIDETGGDFADAQARAEGEDFANVLPGGEIEGHFAVTNQAEVLKLAHRCFAYLKQRG
jgi:hypothetical protein